MTAVSIKNLTKSYKDKTVVNDVTFDIPEKSIYGLIGVNGAGKTTIMKMLLGLVKPTNGDIHIFNQKMIYGSSNCNELNKSVGYLPDVPQFYNYMTATEYLKLCGEIGDITDIKEKSHELLEKLGLNVDKTKIGNFSLGMKKRLGLAQALLISPKLLVCDEPTSALDPIGRMEMLDMLLSLKSSTTILISTHILSDIEKVCDNIAIIDTGKLLFNGDVTTLRHNFPTDVLCVEFSTIEEQERFLHQNKFEYKKDALTLYLKSTDIKYTQQKLYENAINSAVFPSKIEILKPSLENILIEVTS